ncbi:TolB family protein [Frateuria hangzhouensis]|uniref:TolB family protein n=1 Tax=Frateuria hangzhouensis TaxID=2995589 RepID=UPI002260F907|nr:hypothetical protein [Frateuria sp. STR12]MCX7512430.1 hypothetical protein [Frateuria sp. STR12]
MNMCRSAAPFCALLLTSLCFPPVGHAAASQRSVQHSSESILFTRSVEHADRFDPHEGSGLFRVNPNNGKVIQLTPVVLDLYNREGSWSPRGGSIAYVHFTAATRDRAQIFVMDRQGNSRRITRGAGSHEAPAWGPGARIAYITDFGNQKCVSLVHSDGSNQRQLFCPSRAWQIARLKWSQDGKNIYVEVGHETAPFNWHSNIWRINVATNLVTKLFSFDSYWRGFVEISDDGSRAIYTDAGPEDTAMLADLVTGDTKILQGDIHGAVFSHDGRHIAFSRFEAANGAIYLSPFVMNADGTNQHRVIDTPIPRASYTVIAWSKDNCHILVDPHLDQQDEEGNNAGARVWIIDVASHAVAKIARGTPNAGSWYEP